MDGYIYNLELYIYNSGSHALELAEEPDGPDGPEGAHDAHGEERRARRDGDGPGMYNMILYNIILYNIMILYYTMMILQWRRDGDGPGA